MLQRDRHNVWHLSDFDIPASLSEGRSLSVLPRNIGRITLARDDHQQYHDEYNEDENNERLLRSEDILPSFPPAGIGGDTLIDEPKLDLEEVAYAHKTVPSPWENEADFPPVDLEELAYAPQNHY